MIKGLDNPFFQTMQKGIEDKAKELGVSLTVQAAQNMGDATGQADRLSALALQDFGCYIVNPISVSNLVQALVPVGQKKVPIVNIDSQVDTEQAKAAGFAVTTYVGTDNVAAGRLAGEEMLRLVPAGSKVALIAGIVGDLGSNARIKGFKEATEGKLEAVVLVSADWDREKAYTAATDILRAHPDVAGFFAANDIMALGAQRASGSGRQEERQGDRSRRHRRRHEVGGSRRPCGDGRAVSLCRRRDGRGSLRGCGKGRDPARQGRRAGPGRQQGERGRLAEELPGSRRRLSRSAARSPREMNTPSRSSTVEARSKAEGRRPSRAAAVLSPSFWADWASAVGLVGLVIVFSILQARLPDRT